MATQREPYVRSFTLDSVPTINSRGEVQHIGRFDGINNKTEHWDHLRKDEELWSQDADCLIHFYAANTSRRGPSLKIPLKVVEQTKSRFLLEQCLHRPAPASPINSEDDNSDSGYSGSVTGSQHGSFELHIPSPPYPTRQQAHTFHLTTRNFFAFLLDVPLVGPTLGTALTQLWHRLQLWQVDDTCESKFHTYCEDQGYLSYVENPDYAAASLYFAEQTKAREMWSETFTHCVGMYERLVHSEDYARLCDETKDMLARSAIDMKAHIVGVTESLGTFLEEDLGPEKLGLSKQLRDHLDRFRSTLHLFYVHEINGYFPPDANDPWGKRLWHGMYNDFHNLYIYLADTKSTDEHASILGSQGGLCVAQNLNAFDHRHGFIALPYTMPLLPEHQISTQSWTAGPRRTFGSLRVKRSNTNSPPKSSPRQALSKASNQSDSSVTSNRLVQEYIRFENLKDEEKVPATEARKVRWILVYSVLQLLISITKAPAEVRHTQGTTYPLCVLDSACPTWPEDHLTVPRPEQHAAQYLAAVEEVRKSFEEDRISIHPDCEASCAADYFSMNSLPRNDPSPPPATAAIPPLRRSLTLSRTASIRSSVSTLHRSVVGSLARRNSSRRNSILAPSAKSPTQGTFCETLHELQGSEVGESSPVDSIMNVDSKFDEAKAVPFEQQQSKWTDAPALEMQQLSLTESAVPMRKLRHTNGMRRHKRIKSRSGPVNCGTSLSEETLDSNAPMDLPQKLASDLSTFAGFQFDFDIPQKTADSDKQKSTAPPALYHESTPGKWANINVGCYEPTGQFTRKNRVASDASLASIASNTSSNYPEDSLQADDIEEEDVRGRGRVRGLGRRQHLAFVHVR